MRITVVSKIGKKATIAIVSQGNFFGEGLLAAQPLRMGSAVAMTESEILRVEKKAMMDVLHLEPAFSERFVAYLLARILARTALRKPWPPRPAIKRHGIAVGEVKRVRSVPLSGGPHGLAPPRKRSSHYDGRLHPQFPTPPEENDVHLPPLSGSVADGRRKGKLPPPA